jgi:translation initiation factor IF-3
LAYDSDLDLVEINPNRQPPIVKLIDFGKYRYEIEKKQREAKAKTKGPELKEIRLTRKIDTHDRDTKARRAKEWLNDGDKVRVYLQLMGREFMFADQAKAFLLQFAEDIGGVFEQTPTLFGNRIIAIIRKK